jgi:uronate dehydrogenase
MTGHRRVLITGAAGGVGTILRSRLPAYGWDLSLLDQVPVTGGRTGDVTNAADIQSALEGVDALVHLAGETREAPWPVIRATNFDGLMTVFDGVRRQRVRRVILASSNHAVGFTPMAPELAADMALGRYHADRYGLQGICLRIGTCIPEPRNKRELTTWLSPDDCARLVDAALRTTVRFAIAWGVSANTRRQWSADAGRAIGFEARHDAEAFAPSIPAGSAGPEDHLVGGRFTSPDYDLETVELSARRRNSRQSSEIS